MRSFTLRALLIGIALAIFVNLCSPLTESRAFSNFSWSYLPEGAVIPFLFLLLVNFLIGRLREGWMLTPGELLLIFVMVLVANSTPIFLIYMFLSAIASPHYFANPENKWDRELIPYMKKWLIVDDKQAVKWFFEGLPAGEKIPFSAWLTPLAHWLPFFFLLSLTSYLVVILFRQHWMEREKLSYPLMQVPLQLVRWGKGSLFRNYLFWLGVAIPFLIMSEHILHLFFPVLPALPVDHIGCLNWGWTPVRSQPLLCFNFLAFGIGFLLPTDVLCGIWFFYVLTLFEEAIFKRLGVATGYGGMFVWGNAAIAWQSLGAFLVFTLSFIILARRHILPLLKAQPLRFAIPFLLSFLLLLLWLRSSGMPLFVAIPFLILVLLIYLGLARIVCQAGLFYIVPPVIAQNICIYGFGSKLIGKEGMVSLGLSYSWHGDVQDVFAVFSAESARLWEEGGNRGGQFPFAIFLSFLVGLILAPLSILYFGYRDGTLTWNTWIFKAWGPNTYEQVLSQMRNPFSFTAEHFLWALGGASAMLLFTFLHLRFAWWPIHPIGLAVASSFTLYAVYLGAFFAWLIKLAILKWGGLHLYRNVLPLSLGLIIGHYLGRALTLIVYSLFKVGMA